MSENLFRELYSTFGDDFLEVCFNIYLVACGDRKATLIESYNYRGKTARFYADLKAVRTLQNVWSPENSRRTNWK